MTETSMTKALTLSRQIEKFMVYLTFLNGSGAELKAGQEVFISANMTVNKRTTGAQFPIGVVSIGGADAENVTVACCIQRSLKAHAKGGTLAAGVFVKPNGTYNADGTPEYIAAAPALGDYVSAIVLSGGAVDTTLELGILRTPIPLGAVS